MPRQFLHRCLVVMLLVSKLAFGEFAHAMPHGADIDAAAPVADTVPCPDHMQDESTPAGASSEESNGHGPGLHESGLHESGLHENGVHEHEPMSGDCCEQGACDCPCPYTPAAVSLVVQGVITTLSSQIAATFDGAAPPRPTALFRPPA